MRHFHPQNRDHEFTSRVDDGGSQSHAHKGQYETHNAQHVGFVGKNSPSLVGFLGITESRSEV